MVALGTHFAFIEYLDNQYHALLAEGWVQPTEHAWDGIHRCLTDGKLESGDTPGHLCILGATDHLYVKRDDGEVEWIVNLLQPGEVHRVAVAIQGIDREEMRQRYDGIDPESFYRLNMSEDDFEYTWDFFQPLQAFFQRAGEAGRWVVFRADQ